MKINYITFSNIDEGIIIVYSEENLLLVFYDIYTD